MKLNTIKHLGVTFLLFENCDAAVCPSLPAVICAWGLTGTGLTAVRSALPMNPSHKNRQGKHVRRWKAPNKYASFQHNIGHKEKNPNTRGLVDANDIFVALSLGPVSRCVEMLLQRQTGEWLLTHAVWCVLSWTSQLGFIHAACNNGWGTLFWGVIWGQTTNMLWAPLWFDQITVIATFSIRHGDFQQNSTDALYKGRHYLLFLFLSMTQSLCFSIIPAVHSWKMYSIMYWHKTLWW